MVEVHPQLRSAVKRVPNIAITPRTISFNRRMFAGFARVLSRGASLTEGVAVADLVTPDDLAVPLRVYRPLSAPTPTPVVVWIHGGGKIMGSHEDDLQAAPLADALGATVVSVGYRLAPEHPFPAAHDDLLAAVDFLLEHPERLGVDPGRMVVGGQSAGGGLAASMAQRLYDRGVDLRGQLLVYPMLDDRTATRTDIGPKDHPIWPNRSNDTAWSAYLPNPAGSPSQPEHAVPARRDDLTGLAPAWIGVGTADLFHDEDVAYAERLRAAGVDVTLEIVDDAVHAFEVLAPGAEISQAFVTAQRDWLRSILGVDTTERVGLS